MNQQNAIDDDLFACLQAIHNAKPSTGLLRHFTNLNLTHVINLNETYTRASVVSCQNRGECAGGQRYVDA